MSLTERIRRLEVAMAKKRGEGVDLLAWCLTQYRDVLADMAPADAAAWHAYLATGAGEPPSAPDGAIASASMLEQYFPCILGRLPDNWCDGDVLADLLKTEPTRRKVPAPSKSDPHDEARAQQLIDRLVRELSEEAD